MTRFLPELTPVTRIAIGLTSLIVTLLLLADVALKLVPDKVDMQYKVRESTSERLGLQIAWMLEQDDIMRLQATLDQAIERDSDMLSIAVREENGSLTARSGDHERHWSPTPGKSTLTAVRVPIFKKGEHWGDVEISYAPAVPQTLLDWLHTPLIALLLVIIPAAFLVIYLYLRRSLHYLDPSAAVPDRVKVAFDVLSEGVVIIDRNGLIMLCNKRFQELHPLASDEVIGKRLSELSWLVGPGKVADWPWDVAMRTLQNSSRPSHVITLPDGQEIHVVIKAGPIQDANGIIRGCIVTFHDVTEVHRINSRLADALITLEESKEEIARKNEELFILATRDPMTGCYNRRAFFAEAEPMLAALQTEQREGACIMADIDFFKKVNDTYGHHIGDEVIIAMSRAVSHHLRASDLLCRMGGEEFCMILPDTTEAQALDIAERIREQIEQNVGQGVRSVEGMRVTSSLGVVTLDSGASSLSQLIEYADYALYSSKQNGRNRVTLWQNTMNAVGAA